jgi:hypothetical protein
MNILKKMKAAKFKKRLEQKMQEIANDYPNMENFILYLEACFALLPVEEEAQNVKASILLEYYSISTAKIYYCEHLKGEDWVRFDYIRPAMNIIFDINNKKVISNGVEADLIAMSEDREFIENEYNKAMEAKRGA